MSALDAPAFVTIPEAARLLGVSRQRVHEYLQQPGAALPSIHVPAAKRDYRSRRVDTSAVLAWRADREAKGLPVGPIPAAWMPHDVPEVPPMPIGLMIWRPF